MGELKLKSKHRLLCGDSTIEADVARLMDGGKADLCFTSPPYSDMRDYGGECDLSVEHLAGFITVAEKWCGLFCVNLGVARKNGEVFEYWNTYTNTARSCGLKLLSWNVWDRGCVGAIGALTAMFPIEHEWIFVYGKERSKLFPTVINKNYGKQRKGKVNRNRDGSMGQPKDITYRKKREIGTVYRGRIEDNFPDHPAPYPVALPSEYIEACCKKGNGVFDPFLGSGTTLIACEQLNRKCYGMEIDPLYCDVIVKRWENLTGEKAVCNG